MMKNTKALQPSATLILAALATTASLSTSASGQTTIIEGTRIPGEAQPSAQSALSAGARMNELGLENSWMAARVGTWDVVETVWDSADGPAKTNKMVAERKMIGSYLQEMLSSPPGEAAPGVKRIDYLSFNRVEGRWKYVSMETRAAVGMMTAQSYDRGSQKRIDIRFDPFTVPGPGTNVSGQMLRMEQSIIQQDANHDRKDQYFTLADGNGANWLAHRYAYTRRRAGGIAGAAVPLPGVSSRIDAIKARGALRVAVLDEYPWLKQNPDGAGKPFQGPAWRLAEEYANRLGVRIETIPVNFENKVSVLASDKVDITIAPLLATPARAKMVDLISYSMSAQSLFGRADNPKVARARGIDDLNRPDVTIAYITGSPQGAWLQKRLPLAARREIPGNLADVPVDEIVAGRADVTTIDKFFFSGLANKTPGLASIPRDHMSSQELPIPIAMAIDKNQPEFLLWLRAVALEIKPQVEAAQAQVEKAGS